MNKREFKRDMVALIKELKTEIGDEYRATDDPEDTLPGMQLTVGADSDNWGYQTGDNSYSGAAYFYADWATVSIYRRSNPHHLAREIIDQLLDSEADVFGESTEDSAT